MQKKSCLIIALLLIVTASAYAENNQKISDKFPFFPSLLNTASGNPTKPEDFEDPIVCSGCHSDIYKQWQGSMHANAFVDPVFHALWKIGAKETGGQTDNLCGGCHAAVGVVSNDLKFKDGADLMVGCGGSIKISVYILLIVF